MLNDFHCKLKGQWTLFWLLFSWYNFRPKSASSRAAGLATWYNLVVKFLRRTLSSCSRKAKSVIMIFSLLKRGRGFFKNDLILYRCKLDEVLTMYFSLNYFISLLSMWNLLILYVLCLVLNIFTRRKKCER